MESLRNNAVQKAFCFLIYTTAYNVSKLRQDDSWSAEFLLQRFHVLSSVHATSLHFIKIKVIFLLLLNLCVKSCFDLKLKDFPGEKKKKISKKPLKKITGKLQVFWTK